MDDSVTPFEGLIYRIYNQLARVRDTLGSVTVQIGRYYYQLASYDRHGAMLIEIVSNEFLPPDNQLDLAAEAQLLGWGFEPPSEISPNWSIAIERADNLALQAMALAVAYALTEAYRVPAPQVFAVLRDITDGKGNRFVLTAELRDDGAVELTGIDTGPVTRKVSRDGHYEYWRTISFEQVDDLVAWHGGEPGDDVIELLAKNWSGPASFELEAALDTAPFQVGLNRF